MRSVVGTKAAAVTKKAAGAGRRRPVVCIDPGHQGHSDLSPEPIGPRSKTMKARVSGGATGTTTKLPEYEIALQISMNLKRRLEERGFRVIMTRTTDDVNISNAERALIANKCKADLFVRVHGNGSPDQSVSGVSVIYPARNRWTSGLAARSKRAAKQVHSSITAQTGAVDRGMTARGDLAGFNWSKSPAILVECGFLSNSVEDRLLASPHYQDKVAEGIAQGVSAYLASEAQR
jgi:N-acetylmuramoyl-L-alanine amidase